MTETSASAEKPVVTLSGELAPEAIFALPTRATLDFSEVTGVSFAALRALLKLQEAENGIDIANASQDVYLFLDGAGARRFLPVTPRPRPFDLTGFHMAGDSNQGDCYFDDQGDSMVKVYKSNVLLVAARKEARGAAAAFASGVPCPIVGGEVMANDKPGILFELARNKKSYTRLIADDPEHIEGYVETFARMARELHETPCDTTLVDPTPKELRHQVEVCPFLDDARKSKLLRFIDDVEPSTMCNHGDLHAGNLVACEAGDLWIDLGEFGYGNPLFDLGSTYFACVTMGEISPEAIMSNFHFPIETMHDAWQLFLRFYFDAKTPAQQAEVEQMLLPFAIMRLVTLCNLTSHMPGGGIYPNLTQLVEDEYFSKI